MNEELENNLALARKHKEEQDKADLELRLQNIKESYAVLIKLKEIGLYSGDLDWQSCWYPNHIKVTEAQLPLLRSAFGICKDSYKRTIHSATNNTVRIYLDIGQPCEFLYYVKTLEPDSPCKIVNQISNNPQLVCEVPS